jgi:hypothetical protein
VFFQLFQNPVGLIAHCDAILVRHRVTGNNNVISMFGKNSAKALNNMAFLEGVGVSGTLTYGVTSGARYAREDRESKVWCKL